MISQTSSVETQRSVAALEALLANGWQVEPPVLARLSWAGRDGDGLDYHFIVARGARRSLVVIPETEELRSMCADRGYVVAYPMPERAPRLRRAAVRA